MTPSPITDTGADFGTDPDEVDFKEVTQEKAFELLKVGLGARDGLVPALMNLCSGRLLDLGAGDTSIPGRGPATSPP